MYSPTRLLLVDGYEYSLRTGLLKRDGKRVRLITGTPPFERAELIRQHIDDSRKGKEGNQPDQQLKVTHDSERLSVSERKGRSQPQHLTQFFWRKESLE